MQSANLKPLSAGPKPWGGCCVVIKPARLAETGKLRHFRAGLQRLIEGFAVKITLNTCLTSSPPNSEVPVS